jgi:hypothetical protein
MAPRSWGAGGSAGTTIGTLELTSDRGGAFGPRDVEMAEIRIRERRLAERLADTDGAGQVLRQGFTTVVEG